MTLSSLAARNRALVATKKLTKKQIEDRSKYLRKQIDQRSRAA